MWFIGEKEGALEIEMEIFGQEDECVFLEQVCKRYSCSEMERSVREEDNSV